MSPALVGWERIPQKAMKGCSVGNNFSPKIYVVRFFSSGYKSLLLTDYLEYKRKCFYSASRRISVCFGDMGRC